MKRRQIFTRLSSYIISLGVIGALLWSPYLFLPNSDSVRSTTSNAAQITPSVNPQKIISGKPIRLEIPSRNINLKVEQGSYNAQTKSWSLSDTNVMYAKMSPQPNNTSGQTFVYGHGTESVLGKIGSSHPDIGSIATIHTENGHLFTYRLSEVRDLKPSDTWIFKDQKGGPPRLVIQTCTGVFSEWRTVFIYNFQKVT